MANPYPASFIDSTGKVRLEGELDFTDPGNQPGGGGGISEIDSGDSSVTITDPTGPNVDLSVANSPKVGGVAVTGTPTAGQVPVASGSAAAAWGTPALRLLFSVTLGSDGTFDQANIPQTASDLLVVFIARGTDAATFDRLSLRFNNDSGTNYQSQDVEGNAAVTSAVQVLASTHSLAGFIAAAGSTSTFFTGTQVWIPGYTSTAWTKQSVATNAFSLGTATGNMLSLLQSSFWLATAAITRIQAFGESTANLKTGSQMRIYGLA
jgi:hypothetical protein